MSSIQLQIYDFAMAAGGSFPLPVAGSYFRILSTTGDVDVIGDTFGRLGPINRGQGLADKQYGRLTIQDRSGAPNSGTILVSDANFIDQTLYGSISLAGDVALDAATLAALETVQVRPELQTSSYAAVSALAANTAEVVFTPAANTNGAILLSAGMGYWDNATNGTEVFITKASAPSSIIDGSVVVESAAVGYAGSFTMSRGKLPKEQRIAAGQGLYFISNRALTTAGAAATCSLRACRYLLL